jgi:predicted dienelactone hydrolase
MNSTRRLLAALALAASLPAAAVNHELTINPIPRGPFAVACSNVQMDGARVAAGVDITEYWEGFNDRYVTDLLVNPQSAVQYDSAVPDQRSTYPGHAGSNVRFVAIVCHPTSRTNADPNYTLPVTGDVIPHMQPAGQTPKLISADEYAATLGNSTAGITAPKALPVILFSHGLTGSPISQGYIQVLVELAAQGFVVAAPFHGDPRFSRVRINNIGDLGFLLTQFDRVVEMQLMRPVSLKSMVDVLLASAYAPAVDASRIGGFGASLGGEAMALLAGASITSTIGGHCETNVPHDGRIRAFATYVPFGGWSFLPAFCQGQSGAAAVSKPFLAISGTADTTAPLDTWQRALEQFSGSRFQVSLAGGEHELRPEDVGDVFTWTVTFLRAYLDVPELGATSLEPMARFIKMRSVVGGRADDITVDVHLPFAETRTFPAPAADETRALEFYNTTLKHFFMAAGPGEVAGIRAGNAGANWVETGQSFKVFSSMPSDAGLTQVTPVCRFYGVPAGGPNSHFFTASPTECENVKRSIGWAYEGIGFYILPVAANGRCPAGFLSVNRAYNPGAAKNDSNHRFTTSDSTLREMGRQGWAVEGTVMCARP